MIFCVSVSKLTTLPNQIRPQRNSAKDIWDMVKRKGSLASTLAARGFHQQPRARRETSDPVDKRPEQSGPIRILRLAQVLDVTGLGKTKIYELQSEGRFPMRVQITDHAVGWVEDEVQAWLAKRIATSPPRRTGRPHVSAV